MPWYIVLQLVLPYGVELTEYVVSLIQKEAQGKPITADDWRGLAKLHASKSADQYLTETAAKP